MKVVYKNLTTHLVSGVVLTFIGLLWAKSAGITDVVHLPTTIAICGLYEIVIVFFDWILKDGADE